MTGASRPGSLRRTAVFISGRGSNMRALVEASREPDFPAEVALVLSNDPAAPGLIWAEAQGVPTLAIAHRDYPSRGAFEEAIGTALIEREIELICLAGFMRLLTSAFVDLWSGRMINIHPSLLPAFRGLDTHARALRAGVRLHGCTAHYVVPEVDAGPIIGQVAVPVLDGDTSDLLAGRVLAEEHRLYPAALRRVAGGQTRLENGRVSGALDGRFVAPDVQPTI